MLTLLGSLIGSMGSCLLVLLEVFEERCRGKLPVDNLRLIFCDAGVEWTRGLMERAWLSNGLIKHAYVGTTTKPNYTHPPLPWSWYLDEMVLASLYPANAWMDWSVSGNIQKWWQWLIRKPAPLYFNRLAIQLDKIVAWVLFHTKIC